ncbi:hypothetical protein ES703_60169 [subsurface metagenome]
MLIPHGHFKVKGPLKGECPFGNIARRVWIVRMRMWIAALRDSYRVNICSISIVMNYSVNSVFSYVSAKTKGIITGMESGVEEIVGRIRTLQPRVNHPRRSFFIGIRLLPEDLNVAVGNLDR